MAWNCVDDWCRNARTALSTCEVVERSEGWFQCVQPTPRILDAGSSAALSDSEQPAH